MSLLVSGCIRNQQKMVSSGEFSLTQPWRLCTPPLRVSPTLWRVIGRRVEPGVTWWTQQNPLHMLRLGSDMSLMLDFNCTIFSLWYFLHILHILTPPLSSSSCVTWSSPGQRWRASQPKCWGAQWWWVVRTHTNVSAIHYKWSIWVVSWESPQTTLCIMKCHSGLSRAHVGGV